MLKVLTESHEKMFEVVSENKTEDSIFLLLKIDPSLLRVVNEIKDSDK